MVRTSLKLQLQALSKKDADYVGILDNRAATYSKLAQYDLALRDARHMIKRDKLDERVIGHLFFPVNIH